MPSPADIQPLCDQLRELYGRTAYSQKTHIIQAGMDIARQSRIKNAEIVLSAITTTGLVTTLFGTGQWGLVISTVASTVLLGLIFYTKDYDLGTVAEQHKHTADELWALRERNLSLLTDIESGAISPDVVMKRRDALILDLDTVYRNARVTSPEAYRAAQKALKLKEDLTFSVEEIDLMLPPRLRKLKPTPPIE